jgi:hypothetical protein
MAFVVITSQILPVCVSILRQLANKSAQLRGSQTVGHPAGTLLVLQWGASLCEEHIYFEKNMGARQNTYFGRHFVWLKYFTYHLVPVLDPNYGQHIL